MIYFRMKELKLTSQMSHVMCITIPVVIDVLDLNLIESAWICWIFAWFVYDSQLYDQSFFSHFRWVFLDSLDLYYEY